MSTCKEAMAESVFPKPMLWAKAQPNPSAAPPPTPPPPPPGTLREGDDADDEADDEDAAPAFS
eukprot:CAMPEP_0171975178 /NCGR_PEP_ID=MMETSP0993-20121228/235992_1 /TAXON_ID=483369 /ORGANISM="non described non described, Strain CCMP2098" /LENGTH=62 /DNA_ID=CAMNT_0012626371 /DNA_START=35 /DNA_END=219 /DNA_ORIENTATION=+